MLGRESVLDAGGGGCGGLGSHERHVGAVLPHLVEERKKKKKKKKK